MTLATFSTCSFRHGAVIVKGGRVISVGINSMRNHPDHVADARTQSSTHAEAAAIRAAGRYTDLSGATIFIARIARDGKTPMMSAPCVNCQKALKEAGIKKVFYTVDGEMDL